MTRVYKTEEVLQYLTFQRVEDVPTWTVYRAEYREWRILVRKRKTARVWHVTMSTTIHVGKSHQHLNIGGRGESRLLAVRQALEAIQELRTRCAGLALKAAGQFEDQDNPTEEK